MSRINTNVFSNENASFNSLFAHKAQIGLLSVDSYIYQPWTKIKGYETVNVLDYLPSSESRVDDKDDSYYIQQAINNSYGKQLYFPAGTYILKSVIYIRDKIHLIGDPGTVFLTDVTGSAIIVQPEGTVSTFMAFDDSPIDPNYMPVHPYGRFISVGRNFVSLQSPDNTLFNEVKNNPDKYLFYAQHTHPGHNDYDFSDTINTGLSLSAWSIDCTGWNNTSGKGRKGSLFEFSPVSANFLSTYTFWNANPYYILKFPFKYNSFLNFCKITNSTGTDFYGLNPSFAGTFTPNGYILKVVNDVVIEGITIRALTTDGWLNGVNQGITLDQTKNCTIINCKLEKLGSVGVTIVRSVKANIQNCQIDDIPQVGNAYGYGVVIGDATRDSSIRFCKMSRCRHAISTGGAYSSSHCIFENNYITEPRATNVPHIDVHEQSYHMYVLNNFMNGYGIGVHIRGQHCLVKNNIISQAHTGILIQPLSPSNDFGYRGNIVDGNVIEDPYVTGIKVVATSNVSSLISLKECRVTNNKIYRTDNHSYTFYAGIVAGTTDDLNGTVIQDPSTIISDPLDFCLIDGNDFSFPKLITQTSLEYGNAIEVGGVNQLVITNNKFTTCSGAMNVENAQRVQISGNSIMLEKNFENTASVVPVSVRIRYIKSAVSFTCNNFISNYDFDNPNNTPVLYIHDPVNTTTHHVIASNIFTGWPETVIRMIMDAAYSGTNRIIIRNNTFQKCTAATNIIYVTQPNLSTITYDSGTNTIQN